MRLDAPICRQLLHVILPRLSLLDPACGSGAFLVAAMKTLINIYSAVVGRAKFLSDNSLNAWIAEMEHGGRSLGYAIKKRIITDNLFGRAVLRQARGEALESDCNWLGRNGRCPVAALNVGNARARPGGGNAAVDVVAHGMRRGSIVAVAGQP